jgi:hypothetical protein
MTPKQWKLLEVLDRWGGMGAIEVETQFGEYDFGSSEAAEAKGYRVTRLVVASLVRSLARKGYAVSGQDGYDITDAGRAALARRTARREG